MNDFFAYLNRMKYIERWSLMHSTQRENIMEHSQQVSVIAHALAVIGNLYFSKHYDENKIAVLALFHESSEVLTGDLPTPIKYATPSLNEAYKALESEANEKLLASLPAEMAGYYTSILNPDKDEYRLVKCADKLCAYIKCVEEVKSGNKEFELAKKANLKEITNSYLTDEVKYFIDNFLPSFDKTLDELD